MFPDPRPLLASVVFSSMLAFGVTAASAAPDEVALVLVRTASGGESRELSLEDLAALPQVTVVTATEFSDGAVAYRGPLARDVLELIGLDSAETVRFTAANDYYIDIPTSDLHRYDVILAMQANGVALSRRDKGPLWLMYPISENPELAGPLYNARLIWQVVRAEEL